MFEYRLDERLTLYNVKSALEQTMSAVKFARDDLNQVLGGCARQRRLAYDKATEPSGFSRGRWKDRRSDVATN